MDDEKVQTGVRLPASTIKRLDAYAEKMRRRYGGVEVTRADAIRLLLIRGLDEVERER